MTLDAKVKPGQVVRTTTHRIQISPKPHPSLGEWRAGLSRIDASIPDDAFVTYGVSGNDGWYVWWTEETFV